VSAKKHHQGQEVSQRSLWYRSVVSLTGDADYPTGRLNWPLSCRAHLAGSLSQSVYRCDIVLLALALCGKKRSSR